MRRLCIYFFFEPAGIVDEYVVDCLRDLSENVENIIFVSNSPLTSESKRTLSALDKVQVTERSNEGFDVWAYKHGIDLVGWRALVEYDEVIFMNFTIVGPLYPLSEMFNSMAARDIDFWGINVHSGEPFDPWGVMKEGFIPKHLQSHFIAVRQNLLKTKAFQNYWNKMRPITSYQEAIGFHEAVFTPTFEKLGYRWESYVNTEDLEDIVSYPLMFMPKDVVLNRRSPFFKRKAPLLTMDQYIGITYGETVADTLRALKSINYDVGKVMPNILRSGNQYDIRMTYRPFVLIPETNTPARAGSSRVVIFYVDSLLKFGVLLEYLPAIAKTSKIIIVARKSIYKKISLSLDEKRVTLLEGKYMDALEQVYGAQPHFDFIGLVGFGSYSPHYTRLGERELYKYGLESLFASSDLIASVTDSLQRDAFVGVYAAPQAYHAHYGSERYAWYTSFSATDKFLKLVGNKMRRDKDTPVYSSESGTFWIKSSSLKSAHFDTFRGMLMKMSDQRAMRIFGFALPFIAQQSGALMTYAASISLAETIMMGLGYQKEQQRMTIERLGSGIASNGQSLLVEPGTSVVKSVVTTPVSNLYYSVSGELAEDFRMPFYLKKARGGTRRAQVVMPVSSDCVRLDPVEGQGVLCRGVKVFVNNIERTVVPINGIRYRDEGVDIFLNNDSQYNIEGAVEKGDRIVILIEYIEYLPSMSGDGLQSAVGDMNLFYQSILSTSRPQAVPRFADARKRFSKVINSKRG